MAGKRRKKVVVNAKRRPPWGLTKKDGKQLQKERDLKNRLFEIEERIGRLEMQHAAALPNTSVAPTVAVGDSNLHRSLLTRAILELVKRWTRRPLSVLQAGATVLANDAEMWRQLHALGREADKESR